MNLTNKLLVYFLQSHKFAKTANIHFKNGAFTFTPSDNDWKNLLNAGIIDNNGSLTQKGMKFQPLPDMEVMPSHIIQTIIERAVEEMANRVYKGYIPSDKMYDSIEILSASIDMVNEMKTETAEIIAARSEEEHYAANSFEYSVEVVGDNPSDFSTEVPAPAKTEEVKESVKK